MMRITWHRGDWEFSKLTFDQSIHCDRTRGGRWILISAFDSIFCIFHATWNLESGWLCFPSFVSFMQSGIWMACIQSGRAVGCFASGSGLPPLNCWSALPLCGKCPSMQLQWSMMNLDNLHICNIHYRDIDQMKFKVTAIKKLWFSNLASVCPHFHKKGEHSFVELYYILHIIVTIIRIEQKVRHSSHLSLL